MTADELTKHYGVKHPGLRKIYRRIEEFSKLSHVCDICDMTFETIIEADKHIDQHDDQLTCTHCGDKFKRPFEYAKHVYSHTGIPKCELCSATLKNRAHLIRHYSSHLKSTRPYLCQHSDCNHRFSGFIALKKHEQKHSGQSSFKCDICSATFLTDSYLKKHLYATHPELRTGKEFNYECVLCDRKFKVKV